MVRTQYRPPCRKQPPTCTGAGFGGCWFSGRVLPRCYHDPEIECRRPGLPSLPMAEDPLPERDREILDFERQWWKYAGAKETAVREKFDMSSTRYYQVLSHLLEQPTALAYDAQLVGRLRRLQDARRAQRSSARTRYDDR
jgi:hypothetical protein